jgi:hypothetical protein
MLIGSVNKCRYAPNLRQGFHHAMWPTGSSLLYFLIKISLVDRVQGKYFSFQLMLLFFKYQTQIGSQYLSKNLVFTTYSLLAKWCI